MWHLRVSGLPSRGLEERSALSRGGRKSSGERQAQGSGGKSWRVRPQEAEGDTVIAPRSTMVSHPTDADMTQSPSLRIPEGQSRRAIEVVSSPEEKGLAQAVESATVWDCSVLLPMSGFPRPSLHLHPLRGVSFLSIVFSPGHPVHSHASLTRQTPPVPDGLRSQDGWPEHNDD